MDGVVTQSIIPIDPEREYLECSFFSEGVCCGVQDHCGRTRSVSSWNSFFHLGGSKSERGGRDSAGQEIDAPAAPPVCVGGKKKKRGRRRTVTRICRDDDCRTRFHPKDRTESEENRQQVVEVERGRDLMRASASASPDRAWKSDAAVLVEQQN